MTADAPTSHRAWPRLRVDDWAETRDTLHMWTQIVGKVRLSQSPMLNHWWQVTLYVSPRGLTTGAIPDGTRIFDVEFDFCNRTRVRADDDGGASATEVESPGPAEPGAIDCDTVTPWANL